MERFVVFLCGFFPIVHLDRLEGESTSVSPSDKLHPLRCKAPHFECGHLCVNRSINGRSGTFGRAPTGPIARRARRTLIDSRVTLPNQCHK